jgi:hypothetical protein
MAYFLKYIFLISMSLFCISCTSISIIDKSGKIHIERSFGFASIGIADDSEMISAKISSFGYVSSPLGHNIGYSSQILSMSNDSCRIVVWIDENVDVDMLVKELGSVDSVCFLK